jgi:hypothetical protein
VPLEFHLVEQETPGNFLRMEGKAYQSKVAKGLTGCLSAQAIEMEAAVEELVVHQLHLRAAKAGVPV